VGVRETVGKGSSGMLPQPILHILETDSTQILKEGTEFFSMSTPPVSSVIPAMDTIDRAFTTASMGDDSFSLPIKVALELGKRILNKYYNLTDESEIHRVSISKFFLSPLLVFV
jgi:hypothetical protein